MDVSSINSFLQALYVYVPKELVIIFLAGSFYRLVRIKRRKTRIINYKWF